jgi:hypothetical protein
VSEGASSIKGKLIELENWDREIPTITRVNARIENVRGIEALLIMVQGMTSELQIAIHQTLNRLKLLRKDLIQTSMQHNTPRRGNGE